jgi:hypothetical protein
MNHSIWLRRGRDNTSDVTDYYQYGSHRFYTGGNIQSQSLRMIINSSGNVGIGTASPGYTLDVAGTIRSSNNPLWSCYKLSMTNQTGVITYNTTTSSRNVTIVLASGTVQVPIAGYYQLNFHTFVDSGSTAAGGGLWFRKNGVTLPPRTYSSEAQAYRPMSLNLVVLLAANDILSVYSENNVLHGNDASNFSGHFIA